MRRIGLQLVVAVAAASGALSQMAVAQDADIKATLQQTLATAEACRIEFGADWEPIVNEGMTNLENFLIEEDEGIPKVDLDVALMDALADGKEMKMTDELREHCRNVMAYGS